MQISDLSPKQRTVMAHAATDETTCLAAGAIRSGKTTAAMLGFALWVLQEGLDHHHALIGYSVEVVMRNVGWPILDVFEMYGSPAKLTRDLGTRIVIPFNGRTAHLWVIGAGDERALKRLQGSTLKGVFLDEAVLIPESFFNVAWGRLSVQGAKMWATYNPDNPAHWFKRKVVDRAQDFDGREHQFLMRDNPSLADEVIERYERSFTGHWKARMIDGVWAGAAGLIFADWHVIEAPLPAGRVSFSLDWGVSSVFAALAIRSRAERAEVFSELYYDAREAEPRTEGEHVEAFMAWAQEAASGPVTGATVWVDPATPASFKRLLRNRGLTVRHADNAVIPGLVTTAARLANGDVRIGECPRLIDELKSYTWDAKKSDQGEDAPVKANDHACDALRYYAHSTGKAFRLAQLTPVSTALRGAP